MGKKERLKRRKINLERREFGGSRNIQLSKIFISIHIEYQVAEVRVIVRKV